jgi:hypothetical protein
MWPTNEGEFFHLIDFIFVGFFHGPKVLFGSDEDFWDFSRKIT